MQLAVEAEPDGVADEFGEATAALRSYVRLLVTAGIERGLLGPREAERIWTRHILNCSAVAPLFPPDIGVVDVGSGAGLPGLVLALRRPDLRVTLVEPLERRTLFLESAVGTLSLASRVRVVRGRAEQPDVAGSVGPATWITARAVAPLPRLMRWCESLMAPGGHVVLLKGRRAAEELAEAEPELTRRGWTDLSVVSSPGPDLGSGPAGAGPRAERPPPESPASGPETQPPRAEPVHAVVGRWLGRRPRNGDRGRP